MTIPIGGYWHARVTVGGGKTPKTGVANDLSYADLERLLVTPWSAQRTFSFQGVLVNDRSSITQIQIVHTTETKEYFAREHNDRMHRSGIRDMATRRNLLPFGRGNDFTDEFLFKPSQPLVENISVDKIIFVCGRLDYAARVLRNRRAGHDDYVIKDEYDAQDLLHAMLRAQFDETIDEEPLGKVANAKSTRADFAISTMGVLIEVKYVHSGSDQKRIVEEIAQDMELYAAWNPLEHLIFLIYGGSKLRDPIALARMSGSRKNKAKVFEVHVIVCG